MNTIYNQEQLTDAEDYMSAHMQIDEVSIDDQQTTAVVYISIGRQSLKATITIEDVDGLMKDAARVQAAYYAAEAAEER